MESSSLVVSDILLEDIFIDANSRVSGDYSFTTNINRNLNNVAIYYFFCIRERSSGTDMLQTSTKLSNLLTQGIALKRQMWVQRDRFNSHI